MRRVAVMPLPVEHFNDQAGRPRMAGLRLMGLYAINDLRQLPTDQRCYIPEAVFQTRHLGASWNDQETVIWCRELLVSR